ncbi:MAG: pantoate--beta-alanine ligase [Actinobacteria bacterium]|nr:pantoate--beta-alanine ligase [Actinomycetota bacterium]
MKTLRRIRALREALEPVVAGRTVGLVPTMGAYHAGHSSLFEAARSECDIVVVSLFVNPAQFEAGDDLASYPRDEKRDRRLAKAAGVDFLFAPSTEEMYPAGYSTWVDVEGLSERLEGRFRPGHFRGVATICLKLFNIVRPTRVYFGQKDAQQTAIVKRLAQDLDLGIEIRVLPTIRDEDGLALSSRNVHLSARERRAAIALPRALEAGHRAWRSGGDPVAAARATLNGLAPDYVEVFGTDERLVLAAAVRIGRTRLIDNVPLDEETP